ncbi:MAG: orotate phosphoribosyltransferase, partial [Cyclobacteriaceae bacterium]|nr:orotate phosphoribosyltransferase [Cyclobacteriaceae bacterium HetDA_MAG_MS6]
PVTWASGWKSPIYCDNRLSLSFPKVRTKIKEAFVRLVQSKYPETEVIAGVATAGIPQGAIVAEAMGLPFVYVRSKSKSHGLTNQIEGHLEGGQKVLVLEDLVSTGGSSLAAVEALRSSGAQVLGMVSIFTYGFPIAATNFASHQIGLTYLSDYTHLLKAAIEGQYIVESTLETLAQWRKGPETWG